MKTFFERIRDQVYPPLFTNVVYVSWSVPSIGTETTPFAGMVL